MYSLYKMSLMMMYLPNSSAFLQSQKFNQLNQLQEVEVVEGEQDVDVEEEQIILLYMPCWRNLMDKE